MKKCFLSLALLALVALPLSSCTELAEIYGEGGTSWIEEGGERPTGHLGVDEEPEHTEHTYDEGVITKEATCNEEGEIVYTCTECGETYTLTIDIDPNNHDYISTETAPTCGMDGYITKECSRCGDIVTEPSGKLATGEHTYDEGVITKEATCTEEGEIVYTCTECGKTLTQVLDIDSNNHDYVSTETEPTCGADGYITKVCSRCENTMIVESGKSATGEHTYSYTKDDTDPSSGHYGVCQVCGETSSLEAHSYIYTINDGNTHIKRCSICGYEIIESHSLALVPDEEGGTHHEKCEICGYMSASVAHEYVLVKDENGTTHSGQCSCGAEILNEGHTYEYQQIGDTHKVTCSLCNYEEIETHYMYETIHSEGTHTSKCICGAEYETISNATYYSVTDENVHSELCSVCDYVVKEEEHTNKGQGDGNCEVCGFSAGLDYRLNESDEYYRLYSVGSYTGTELVFPNYYKGEPVRRVSSGAFGMESDAASSFTYIKIPRNMREIGTFGFVNAPYLEKIDFEERSELSSIGYGAFGFTRSDDYADLFTDFTELSLPNSVTTISSYAFSGRHYLETITFGENSKLESIGNNAFYNCYALKELTIPSNVTSIGDYAFYNCLALQTLTFEEESHLQSIGERAFFNCYNLKALVIPASVTSIGRHAFRIDDEYMESSALTSITFEEGSKLESIGYCNFYNCYNLTELVLPSGITSIDDWAFRYCKSLESLTIPASVTSIGEYAFYYCTSLKSIIFEDNSQLESIGEYAFRSCTSLESITFGEGSKLESIGRASFYECNSLTELEIPANVTYIGINAFYGCNSLTSLTFEEGSKLETIDDQAFCYCYKLEELEIPASVTSIGTYAFFECYELTSLTFEKDSKLEIIGDASFDYNAISELSIPASVKEIGHWAFGDATKLKNVYVEGSEDGTSQLTTLGAVFACYGCIGGLETITLPSSITTVDDDGGYYLFTECTALTTINFYGTQAQWNALLSYGNLGLSNPNNVYVYYLGTSN